MPACISCCCRPPLTPDSARPCASACRRRWMAWLGSVTACCITCRARSYSSCRSSISAHPQYTHARSSTDWFVARVGMRGAHTYNDVNVDVDADALHAARTNRPTLKGARVALLRMTRALSRSPCSS